MSVERTRARVFGEVAAPRSSTWAQRYDAVTYSELLQTHSDHRFLSSKRLDRLIRAVTEIIEDVGGGEMTYPYGTDLLTARRAAIP